MAKEVYIGVSTIAKNSKKMYIGVGGIARKVKKAYIGVNGIARLFYEAELKCIVYQTSTLNVAAHSLGGCEVGNYALFAGGTEETDNTNSVTAFNTSLTKSTPTNLPAKTRRLVGANAGNGAYALFAGGFKGSYNTNDSITNAAYAYNSSLTLSTPTALAASRHYHAGASVGNYALFGGGRSSEFGGSVSTVYAYNASLTRSTASNLSEVKAQLAATKTPSYAIFAGGEGSEHCDTVDAYNSSLTKSTPTRLGVERRSLSANHVGNYALFGGGYCWDSNGRGDCTGAGDAYNNSLVRTTITTQARHSMLTTCVDNKFAVFLGGGASSSSTATYAGAYAFNINLVRSSIDASYARQLGAGASVGSYGIVAGGFNSDSDSPSSTVIIFKAD